MMDFMKACDLARNIFVKRDYKDGLCEIFDSGDRWIFLEGYLKRELLNMEIARLL